MKTDNVRLAAFLLTKGHPVRGVEIAAEGYGVVSFEEEAQADAETFELGAVAPAKALLANYRALIRQLDKRNLVRRGGGA
jgi:hypothetical protein